MSEKKKSIYRDARSREKEFYLTGYVVGLGAAVARIRKHFMSDVRYLIAHKDDEGRYEDKMFELRSKSSLISDMLAYFIERQFHRGMRELEKKFPAGKEQVVEAMNAFIKQYDDGGEWYKGYEDMFRGEHHIWATDTPDDNTIQVKKTKEANNG